MVVPTVLAVALVSAPPLVAGSSTRAPDEKISVRDNFFSPRSVTIEEGDVVRWVWRGDNRHNVTFKKVPPDASRHGGKTRRNGHWQRKFRVAGQYRYVCTLFTGMRGTITVEPPAEESPSGSAVSARDPSQAGLSAGGPR
jgi:plastocyanin